MSLIKKMKNNKAGDVGILSVMIIFFTAMLITMVLDLFTSMLAKEYVINALQVAEMNALVANVETNQEINGGFSVNTQEVITSFSSEIRRRISTGRSTTFKSIDYPVAPASLWVGVNTYQARQSSAFIRAQVVFEPKRFIKKDIGLFEAEAKEPSISVIVASSIYTFRD